MRALNEARKIRDDISAAQFRAVAAGAAVGVDDAEIRLQRSERIIRDFWARCRNHGNQSGLTGIRITHQPNISQKFQLKAKVTLFSGESVFVFARSLMPGFGKVLIAAPPAPAVGDQYTLSGSREIGDCRAVLIKRQRSNRNAQNHVLTGVAGTIRAFAMTAAIGLELA